MGVKFKSHGFGHPWIMGSLTQETYDFTGPGGPSGISQAIFVCEETQRWRSVMIISTANVRMNLGLA